LKDALATLGYYAASVAWQGTAARLQVRALSPSQIRGSVPSY